MPRRAPNAPPIVRDRPIPRFLLTVEEAGVAIGIGPAMAHRLASEGTLPTCRPFGLKGRRVKVSELAALVDAIETTGR